MSNSIFGEMTFDTNATVDDSPESFNRGGALPSAVYPAQIKHAYVRNSNSSQAKAIVLVFEIENHGEKSFPIWFTNGNGQATYTDKQGNTQNLPGINQLNTISNLLVGKNLTELVQAEAVIALWDFTAKDKVNTQVQHLPEFAGKECNVGLVREIRNRQVRDESTGKYTPTTDTIQVNDLRTVFTGGKVPLSLHDLNEYIASLNLTKEQAFRSPDLLSNLSEDRATSYAKWMERYAGKDIDRRELKDGGTATGTSTKPKPKLFD